MTSRAWADISDMADISGMSEIDYYLTYVFVTRDKYMSGASQCVSHMANALTSTRHIFVTCAHTRMHAA
jgi:hypothetical protein